MLTRKELFERGFKEYKPTVFDNADKCYQKCYRDGNTKKYFLDVKHYSIKYPHTHEDLGGYEISTQVYVKGTHTAINIKFLNDDIDEAEKFIDELFEVGQLEPYEVN